MTGLASRTVVVAVVVVVVVVAVVGALFATGMLGGGGQPPRQGKVVRIVSNKDSYIPPENWKPGDPPIISDRYFSPSRVTLNVGDTVEYVNEDTTPHTFTTMKGKAPASFDSGPVEPGKSFRYTFRTAGEYNVYCTLHPHKGAVINVLP
ncbi:MAG: plastocyanin/azurin family copper-binding protein [Aigarchaeota archaeon]|nr:plastocyanin/azurin family copper-binding protein [Candidatus Calditenuis fumarioli]